MLPGGNPKIIIDFLANDQLSKKVEKINDEIGDMGIVNVPRLATSFTNLGVIAGGSITGISFAVGALNKEMKDLIKQKDFP